MFLLKTLRMPTKNFLQFSLMVTRLNSKQIPENFTFRSASTVTYEACPYNQQMEKSLDKPDSPLRWGIRISIEKGCPEIPEDTRIGITDSPDRKFLYILRKKCRTITDREDRRDTVREVMKSNIIRCGENLAYEYFCRYEEASKSIFHYDLSKPTFWQSALKCSKNQEFVELKKILEKAGIKVCDLSNAIAKVFAYLDSCDSPDFTSWRRSFGPEDVKDVLRNVNLNETYFKSIQILFSLSYFKNNRI